MVFMYHDNTMLSEHDKTILKNVKCFCAMVI